MTFDEIKGNDAVKRALNGMVSSGRIPHAIMFHEDDGGGAIAFCQAFLQTVIPSGRVSKMIHPDVHYVFPVAGEATAEKFLSEWRELVIKNPYFTENRLSEALGVVGKNTMIAAAEAKGILGMLALNSLEGGYKAVVIYLPERMNPTAANRLLKALEEPSPGTLFLLVTHAPEKVLATISSRCQRIRIVPERGDTGRKEDESGMLRGMVDAMFNAVVARNFTAMLQAGESAAALPSRDMARSFCYLASVRMRQVFLCQQGLEDLAGDDPGAAELAMKLRKTYPRKALEVLGQTDILIERNVNVKILFADLACRLYSNI